MVITVETQDAHTAKTEVPLKIFASFIHMIFRGPGYGQSDTGDTTLL